MFEFNFENFFTRGQPDLRKILITEGDKPPGKYVSSAMNSAIAIVMKGLQKNDTSSVAVRSQLESIPQPAGISIEAKSEPVQITVQSVDCMIAAKAMHQQYPGQVALINMANRQSVGGNVFNGSAAQEEKMCVVSDLAGSLLKYAQQNNGFQALDWEQNARANYGINTFNSTDVLYSTNKVTRELDKQLNIRDLPPEEQFQVNFITSAALRYNPVTKVNYDRVTDSSADEIIYSPQESAKLLHQTIYNQIYTIIANGNKAAVLSAFGCGAFKNDSAIISKIYRDVLSLPEFHGKLAIQFVVFQGDNTKNFENFTNTFSAPMVQASAQQAQKIHELVLGGKSSEHVSKKRI